MSQLAPASREREDVSYYPDLQVAYTAETLQEAPGPLVVGAGVVTAERVGVEDQAQPDGCEVLEIARGDEMG